MVAINQVIYTALDFEASYSSVIGIHEIIQIGAVRLHPPKLELGEQFNTLVRPEYPIIRPIVEKTGITDHAVRDAPRIQEVWDDFSKFLDGSILIAHQASLERTVLDGNARRYGFPQVSNQMLDTLKLARLIYKDLPSYSLDNLQKLVDIQLRPHSAIDDAVVTAKLFVHLTQMLEQKFGLTELNELFEIDARKDFLQRRLF